jgi:putative acetyltransferase
MSLRIVTADPQGEAALSLLRQAALEARALYPELHAPGAPWPGNEPTPPGGIYLLAWLDGELGGMGAHRPLDARSTEVRRMFVRESARRRGVARALLEALQAHAIEQGFTRLCLETGFRQQAAIHLYESFGFHRIAPFGPYVGDPTSVCFEKLIG